MFPHATCMLWNINNNRRRAGCPGRGWDGSREPRWIVAAGDGIVGVQFQVMRWHQVSTRAGKKTLFLFCFREEKRKL